MVPTADSFLTSLSKFAADEGLPPAAGRMLGWLLLRSGPSSLDEVAEGLRISKSAASDQGRLLARLGVVEVRRHPGDRRDFYEASDRLCERLLENFLVRMEALGRHLGEGAQVASADTGAQRRLASARGQNQEITGHLRGFLTSVREREGSSNG